MTGEGGIGKTRLIAEVGPRRRRASPSSTGAATRTSCSRSAPGSRCSAGALARVADEELAALLGEEGPDLARLLPELRGRVPGLAAPAASDPESELRHLYTAVVALVRRLARRRPLLAIIDDLHWADRSSLLLGRHLVRTLGVGPALLLGTYRDTELSEHHPLLEVLADLERDGRCRASRCAGSTPARWRSWPTPRGMASIRDGRRRSARRPHGNPFFVKQLVRHLDESGIRAIRSAPGCAT